MRSTAACWTGSDACTRQGAQLYAACGGSLVLAEAGLLDGRSRDDALELRAAVPPALSQR